MGEVHGGNLRLRHVGEDGVGVEAWCIVGGLRGRRGGGRLGLGLGSRCIEQLAVLTDMYPGVRSRGSHGRGSRGRF